MVARRRARGPDRRTVLIATAVAAVGVLPAGCSFGSGTNPPPTPRVPTPDELAARRAIASARALIEAEGSLARDPLLAPLVRRFAADHQAHLGALGVAPAVASAATASAATSAAATRGAATSAATSSAATVPGASAPTTPSVTPASAVRAEQAAAGEALADVPLTTAGVAGLLARIAATRAVHADLLAAAARLPVPGEPASTAPHASTPATAPHASTPATAPHASTPATRASSSAVPTISTPTTAPLDPAAGAALSMLLAAEHAAVFGYGLITARADGARQVLARSLWLDHRVRRDQLQARLAAAGVTPPAARPAYDVGRPPVTPAQVAALAARVEDGMATVALSTVTTTSGPLRIEAALDLVHAARRSADWRGTPEPLPG